MLGLSLGENKRNNKINKATKKEEKDKIKKVLIVLAKKSLLNNKKSRSQRMIKLSKGIFLVS